MLDRKQLSADNILEIAAPSNTAKQLNVLLVEPDVAGIVNQQMMLLERYYRVTTVKDVREIFFLREKASFAVVVLSTLIGPFALVESARSVRRQWPVARIVIIGHAANVLEDHLYDETVARSCQPQELVDVLKQVVCDPWTRQAVGRSFVVQAPACGPTAAHSLRADIGPPTSVAADVVGVGRLQTR